MEKAEIKDIKDSMGHKKTVVEAAKQYKEVSNEAAKKKITESFGIKTYLPVKDKMRIIYDTVYNKLGQVDESGLASYDGIDGMVYLILSIIEGYTDLVTDDELEDFDALMSTGLMDAILAAIGDDAEVFKEMFDVELDQFMQEHNTLFTYIQIIMQGILEPLGKWSSSITDFIDENGGIENFSATIQDLLTQVNTK